MAHHRTQRTAEQKMTGCLGVCLAILLAVVFGGFALLLWR